MFDAVYLCIVIAFLSAIYIVFLIIGEIKHAVSRKDLKVTKVGLKVEFFNLSITRRKLSKRLDK